ncbi:MAG: methyltransferase domain-containing protein [Elusimicrobia bacterium]|nr:methyltransferase domain-containing protein [Elusimicrobiota bacterium]
MVVEKKRRLVSLTIDYETWQPVPAGLRIDWEKDVFDPARRFIDIGLSAGLPLTFMAEMGEYLWLKKFKPEVAAKMEEQWREMVLAGHDVQLHLHPSWLPETGASETNGDYRWDADKSKFEDYPGDTVELMARAKAALESAIRPAKAGYRATCFRAGAYQAQPFTRLREALVKNGILADSSVHLGGVSAERGYDYSFAYSDHQPFFASAYDPQLRACPAEAGLVEIPVFTWKPGERWFLDGGEGPMLAERLLSYHDRRPTSTEIYRLGKKLKRAWRGVYGRLAFARPLLNRHLPSALAYALVEHPPLPPAQHDYFVAIGHTKGDHDFDALRKNFETLKLDGRFEIVGLGEMAAVANAELGAGVRPSAADEAAYQVQRESAAILGEERNEAQSFYLQEKIPFDRSRILDLGCGAGYWAARIAGRMPWAKVTGVDAGEPFIAKARQRYGGDRVSFQTADFANLPFAAGAFDCVYADNVLEHAFDVDAVLRECFRVLEAGGVLVAAIPSDGRNPKRSTDNHTWKTIPSDVRFRLARAGFSKIRIEEVDVRARFGMTPYPPSFDCMMYVVSEKREAGFGDRERALRAMHWVHERLDPSRGQRTNDPHEILKEGVAFCWGYVVALGTILKKEGFDVTWVSMIAANHPRGRGAEKTDSHEVLELRMDGDVIVLDPMANTVHEHSVDELIETPSLAKGNPNPDAVHRERGYQLYDTAEWYGRVIKVARRQDYADRLQWKEVPPRGIEPPLRP